MDSGPATPPQPAGAASATLGRVLAFNLVVCEIMVAVMVGFITLEVVGRAVFGLSFDMTEEVSGYLLVAVVFLATGVGLREGGLLRVDFLFNRLRPRVQSMLGLVYDMLALGFTLILTWQCWRLVLSSWRREMISSSSLETPLWIPQAVMPIGAALLALALVEQIVLRLRELRAGR